MVSQGLSQAAVMLALAMGSTAFVPSKMGSTTRVGSNMLSPVEQKIESCDAILARNPGKVS